MKKVLTNSKQDAVGNDVDRIPVSGDSLSNSEILLLLVVALFLRLATGLHKHSGQGQPPLFGDFEAQRHWVEITKNVAVLTLR